MTGITKYKPHRNSNELDNGEKRYACGLCKGIGAVYGCLPRFALNVDVSFLMSLLDACSARPENWCSRTRSLNCLKLPREGISPLQRFGAAVNMIMADVHLKDHVTDSGKVRYRVARRTLRGAFGKIEGEAEVLGLPLDEIRELAEEQLRLEENAALVDGGRESLTAYASPTAGMFAAVYAAGARVIGRSDLRETLRAVGGEFGRIVYLLDALEDFEKDSQMGQFNAIARAYGLRGSQLGVRPRIVVSGLLNGAVESFCHGLRDLPIDEKTAEVFAERVRFNVARRSGASRMPAERAHGLKAKIRYCWNRAAEIAAGWRRPRGVLGKAGISLGAFAVFATLMLLPRSALTAEPQTTLRADGCGSCLCALICLGIAAAVSENAKKQRTRGGIIIVRRRQSFCERLCS